MKIRMELLSDVILGNGISVPGGEDISVLHDVDGFPFYRGTTLKGIFREELLNYLEWNGNAESEEEATRLLGNVGDKQSGQKIVFGDLTLSSGVRSVILNEMKDKERHGNAVLEALTNMRTFTRINEMGIADEGSLRMARCVNSGLIFYGDVLCAPEDEPMVEEVLGMIKWIGTMRNRGFGQVRITKVQ